MKLTEWDKKLINLLQGDLPTVARPFAWLAERLGSSEEEVVERIKAFDDGGLLRRFGATLYHQRTGFQSNVMVAWEVREDRIEEVGRRLAKNRAVSHCYQRRTAPDWPFNLYTMIHGENDEAILKTVENLAREAEACDYRLLFSVEELKKTSMRYFA
jgi:DNA-binding Lrp family transcriptional regulator